MFANSRILITGGTGSWGYELVAQLLRAAPKEIVVYSRNESSQVAMKRMLEEENVRFCIGDIRDKDALMSACADIDYIFHLAALKHVPICEEQPYEALKTNVIGTQNVIEAAIANKVKKVVYVSTDKAANPSNVYGMTKAIGEKLIIYANWLGSKTRFLCVRGGNVLGTSGSVVHLFMSQIREKNQIGITDKRMTRFFMTMKEAISLLLKAAGDSIGGETYVLVMPQCRIIDLAEVLVEAVGGKETKIFEIGVRPGEKLHEVLLSDTEKQNAIVVDERYIVILPSVKIPELEKVYAGYPLAFAGNGAIMRDKLMTKEEIRHLLVKGGFIG